MADPEGPEEPELVVHNQWQFPMDVRASSAEASTGFNEGDAELSIGGLVMRFLNAAAKGWGLVGGPGTTWVGPPEDFGASGQPLSVDLEANWLGLALDVIDTSLAIVPDWEVSETRVRVEFQAVPHDVQVGAVHVTSFEQALTIVVQRLKVEKGDGIEAAEKIVSGAECLTELVGGAVVAKKVDGKKITKAVAGCLKDLLADVGDGLVHNASEFGDYLNGSAGVVAGTADDEEDRLGAGDVYNLAVYAVKDGLTPATGTPICHALGPGETTSHLTTPAWCRYPGRDSVQYIAGQIPGSRWVVTQVEFGN